MIRIGVDLGGTKIEAIAMADDGSVLDRERVPTPRGSYAETLAQMVALVTRLEVRVESSSGGRRAGAGLRARVGIGTPGAVSPATGRMKNANSTWLNDRPLKEDLEAALGRPIRMANDADCFALSEACDGAGQDGRVVFGVILGTGVGGGIVVDGKLLHGPNAIAGEWGHNPLPDSSPARDCYCGRRGCVETLLSGPALERDFESETGRRLPAREVVRLAEETSAPESGTTRDALRGPADPGGHADPVGDADAVGNADPVGDADPVLIRAAFEVLARYEDRLARALAAVINLLDPDVIVLGGGMSNVERIYRSVPARWERYIFSDRVDTQLVPPTHGDSSGVRGAARLWPADDEGRD